MGQDVEDREFTREDRARYRTKVRRCLDVFARMLAERDFDATPPELLSPMTGLEIELNLVDDAFDPALRNAEVLEAIADPAYQTELGQYTIEINVEPRRLAGEGAAQVEGDVRATLNRAEERAREAGGRIVMIGILPTLTREHLSAAAISATPRYALLDASILAARGEDVHLAIDGPEHLDTTTDSIAPEGACTSAQFHLQVSPAAFPSYWNAAQAVAGAQLALGANSPYLLGRELWRETRIALFEQATDTRPEELKAQGVRPRVWFGERWITSIFDLFEENVRYFPALLPVCDDEDPVEAFERGDVPALGELRLHNGTVYRWNRPVYDVVDGRPHLRVENRVLPAGPTVVDILANAAFFYGVTRTLADADRPVWTQLSFPAAEENFHAGAQRGMAARLYWPGTGEVAAPELVLRTLLPMAARGLDDLGVDGAVAGRLLDVIEGRCLTERNGATWQVETVRRAEAAGMDRTQALHAMVASYVGHMHRNDPVHTWPLGPDAPGPGE